MTSRSKPELSATHRVDPVVTPEVNGVAVRRHDLDVETERLMLLARRVGKRLQRWITTMPADRTALRKTNDGYEPILNAETGRPMTAPLIPDQEWVDSAKWYSKVVVDLLREQRERAKMRPGAGAPAVDDETFALELRDLAREELAKMSAEQITALLSEARAIEVPSVAENDAHEPAPLVSRDDV